MDPSHLNLPKKIDFYAGAHGNFLELLINLCAYPKMIDTSQPLFDENGACHLKYYPDLHSQYRQTIGCGHYSVLGKKFSPSDRVVEIEISDPHKITVILNAHLRAGNQRLDIENLETDTLAKLEKVPKKRPWADFLIKEYGVRKDYPASAFRLLYFTEYSSNLNQFSHVGSKLKFTHDNFFDLAQLQSGLQQICDFFDLPYTAHADIPEIWEKFVSINQGLFYKKRCDDILQSILAGQDVDLTNLIIPEQAWLLYRLFPTKKEAEPWFEQFPERSASIVASRQLLAT